ncbi:MAG: hypothetical protein K0S25_1028 [Bacillus sp. (in: firmicutes)]|jgi:hypothetical protein|nr:hypothetical protein [Bacillus sp. (in: firmicutes)]
MPYQINIFSIKTNGMTSNANVDIGPTVHNSHTSNYKTVGSNIAYGDISSSNAVSTNGVADIDVSDQDQIANPSLPMVNQL